MEGRERVVVWCCCWREGTRQIQEVQLERVKTFEQAKCGCVRRLDTQSSQDEAPLSDEYNRRLVS